MGYYSDVSSPGKGSVKSGTIQIPIKVSKAAAASRAAASSPKTAISYKGGTVQIPKDQSAGIQALMQKPAASALKKSAARGGEGAERRPYDEGQALLLCAQHRCGAAAL